MDVGKYLREHDAAVRVHPVVPAESPTFSAGCKAASHRIQGISDEFTPAIVQLKELSEVISIHDGDSILTAQKLANTRGWPWGFPRDAISSPPFARRKWQVQRYE